MNAPSRSSADTARPGSDEQDAPAFPAPPQGEREAFEGLSAKLWCDLRTDEDRSAWLLLGRGHETGVVAKALQNDLAMAYHRLALLSASLRASPAVPVAQDEREAPGVDAAYEMGAKGGPVSEAERLAFEAWMRGHCWALCAEWTGSQYLGSSEQGGDVDPRAMMTRRLWAAWRDRAALSAAMAPPADNKENGNGA